MNSRHDDKLEIGDLSSFEDTKGRYVITCGSSLVVPAGDSDFFWSHEALEKRVPAATRSHFLGRYNGELFFAVEIPEGDQSALGGELCSLRSLLGKLSEGLFKLLGRAVQITGWYRDHRYCGRCGAETVQLEHDRAMACPRCDMVFYPRLSPCIMALITRGDECLLARNASWQFLQCAGGLYRARRIGGGGPAPGGHGGGGSGGGQPTLFRQPALAFPGAVDDRFFCRLRGRGNRGGRRRDCRGQLVPLPGPATDSRRIFPVGATDPQLYTTV